MPVLWVKRGLWAGGILVLASALTVVALPVIASNRIVRDRIAVEMGTWSGFRVAIEEDPQIQVWPRFRAILTGVTLEPWGNTSGKPVIEAERVEVGLSAWAALRGDVVFSRARLIRPTVRVEPTFGGLYLPRLPGGGRISRSIDLARAIVAEDRTAPDIWRFPDDPLGTIEFEDGRIVEGPGPDPTEIVTNLDGKLDWPALNQPASFTSTGVWHGEDVALDLSSTSPLLLFGGGTAPLVVSARSAPVSFQFDGTGNIMQNAYFDGRAKFEAPSLRRMLEWSHAGVSPGAAIGSVAITGRVAGSSQRVKIEDAEIALDGNPGTGVLDILLSGTLPVVAGSLAFESLDLRSFLSAFTPLEQSQTAGPGSIDASFADRVNLDLRLSSQKATLGPVALTGVAATARVKDGLAAFDISDASAFGGTIQSGIRFDRKLDGTQVEMRLLASGIEGGAFGSALGMTRMVPVGRGTVSVILKGPGDSWDEILENANGSVSATFGPGAISGFDLASFLDHAQKGGFFSLDTVSKGTLQTGGLELKANIANGVATIDKAEARTDKYRIVLSGIIPYVGRGLALSGSVWSTAQPTGTTPASATADFFVGGPWTKPFISPIAKRITEE